MAEGEPLVLGEGEAHSEPLPLCVGVCEAQRLLLGVKDALTVTEGVKEMEGEPECECVPERVRDEQPVALCDGVCEAQWVLLSEGEALPQGDAVPEGGCELVTEVL